MPHTTSRSVSLYFCHCIMSFVLALSPVAMLQGQAKGAYKDAKHSL